MSKKQEELDTVRKALESEENKGPQGVQNAIAVKLFLWVIALSLIMFLWNLASELEVSAPLIILGGTIAGLMLITYFTDREARAENSTVILGCGIVALVFVVGVIVLRLM